MDFKENPILGIVSHILAIYVADKDDIKEAQDCGCGCLYKEDDKTYILSVKHVTTIDPNKRIFIPSSKSATGFKYLKKGFNFFELYKINDDGTLKPKIEGKGIDFVWSLKDNSETFKLYEWVDETKRRIRELGEITPFTKLVSPTLDGKYFFGGTANQILNKAGKRFDGEFIFYECEYTQKCCDDKYYEFEVMQENNSELVDLSLLPGLSGTPIFDSEYNLVSLLVSGHPEGKVVYGINLNWALNMIHMQEEAEKYL